MSDSRFTRNNYFLLKLLAGVAAFALLAAVLAKQTIVVAGVAGMALATGASLAFFPVIVNILAAVIVSTILLAFMTSAAMSRPSRPLYSNYGLGYAPTSSFWGGFWGYPSRPIINNRTTYGGGILGGGPLHTHGGHAQGGGTVHAHGHNHSTPVHRHQADRSSTPSSVGMGGHGHGHGHR
jgi:hypothetical protein